MIGITSGGAAQGSVMPNPLRDDGTIPTGMMAKCRMGAAAQPALHGDARRAS